MEREGSIDYIRSIVSYDHMNILIDIREYYRHKNVNSIPYDDIKNRLVYPWSEEDIGHLRCVCSTDSRMNVRIDDMNIVDIDRLDDVCNIIENHLIGDIIQSYDTIDEDMVCEDDILQVSSDDDMYDIDSTIHTMKKMVDRLTGIHDDLMSYR